MKHEKSAILDPQGILQHESISLESKQGHKVMVTEKTIGWGRDYDKEQAKKFLEVGKVYTVESMEVHNWSSSVTLKEIPNEEFNSVHFVDAE